jgi:hypothetical protein
MLSNQKDREIEHLSEQTSLSHNAKDYARFFRARSGLTSLRRAKLSKEKSAEGRSPAEQMPEAA